MSDAPAFNLHLEASYTLNTEGFWPDGDAPNPPTAEAAAEVVREYIADHGIRRFLSEWDLTDFEWSVT